MEYWKKDRNYRSYGNADGTFRYVVTVDGEEVTVSRDVYLEYSRADRRERYSYEREDGLVLSLERLEEDGVPCARLENLHAESAEDTAIRNLLGKSAMDALKGLPREDRLLIEAIVLDGVTERQYARQIGMSQKGVNKRKHRVLKKLFEILVLKTPEFRDGK